MTTNHIIRYLQQMRIPTVDDHYRAYIDQWRDWYAGKVEAFHKYSVYNGIKQISVERASLNMAKTVAEDWANLLLNERVVIAADDERKQAALDELLRINRFGIEGNRTVERAFALGTGAWSEYLDANGVARIDYHDAMSIWPLAWQGNKITECAFASVESIDGIKCIYLRMYRRGVAGYVINNIWLDEESGKQIKGPENVQAEVQTYLQRPPFQIIEPNIANNIDTTCPMGISVFANAIDALKGVDVAFDSFKNEYILGRKRLMVPVSMVRVEMEKDGTRGPVFDPNDLVYTAYTPGEDQKDGFHDLSPEIRADEHLIGIRTQLNILSFKCGLGSGRYEFERTGGVRTATEVVSEQSDLYQSLQKHAKVLHDALWDLAHTLLSMSGYKEPGEITITFDDSIIQDKSTIRSEAREEVRDGLMSKFMYLTTVRGLSEEKANEELERIRSENKVTAETVDFFSALGSGNA